MQATRNRAGNSSQDSCKQLCDEGHGWMCVMARWLPSVAMQSQEQQSQLIIAIPNPPSHHQSAGYMPKSLKMYQLATDA
eukprot:1294735-Amphidinium_carterae.1